MNFNDNSEEIAFDMCAKFQVNINNSTDTYECIINDANEWQQNTDAIILIKKYILSSIKCGDMIRCSNVDYIVSFEPEDRDFFWSAKMRKTNNTLTFYKNKTLYTLPCILQSGSGNYLGTEENKFIISPNSRYKCFISDLGYIDKSDLNLRFIINGAAYKIEAIDNVSSVGLIVMELNDDTITNDDNMELGIANYYSNQPTETPSTDETIVTLTPIDNKLILGTTLELTAHTFVNDVEDLTKYYLFTVTNVDGTTNKYVDVVTLGNVCTLTARTTSECLGKLINVHVNLLGEPSIYYDRQIKLIAF